MPTKISKLAVVDPGAQIGLDVEIGPFCVVGPKAKIGDRTKLHNHVTVLGNVTVGMENEIPQRRHWRCSPGRELPGN